MTDAEIKQQLEIFFSQYTSINYSKNDLIIREDDQPHGVYFLTSGLVKMSTINSHGEELTLNIFKPGSFFPMSWAINQLSNTYTYQCITPVKVWRAPPSGVVDFLIQNPQIHLDLTRRILSGLWGLLNQMQILMHSRSESKIINILLILATRFGTSQSPDNIKINIHLTHQEIASLAGTSRETVTRLFTKLKKSQHLQITSDSITIPDINKFSQLLQPDHA